MSLQVKDLFNVSGKTALVTGGSRGIGEMITSGFLANGAKVYITARKEEALNLKAKELSDLYGVECIPFSGDLSNQEGIQKLICHEKVDLGFDTYPCFEFGSRQKSGT